MSLKLLIRLMSAASALLMAIRLWGELKASSASKKSSRPRAARPAAQRKRKSAVAKKKAVPARKAHKAAA